MPNFGVYFLFLVLVSHVFSQECKSYSTKDPCDRKKIKLYCEGVEIKFDIEKEEISEKSLKKSHYDPREMTTLVLHGLDLEEDRQYFSTLLSTYQKEYKYNLKNPRNENVLEADYSELVNKKCYKISEGNLDYIGYCLAKIISYINIFERGLFIVGFDIGALLMTTFARHFPGRIRSTTGILGVSALDPAGSPYIEEPNISLIKDQNISTYRDCIHTNGNKYGIKCGQADFYVNIDKDIQPGCEGSTRLESELCSHRRSWIYFNESIRHPGSFYGYKCNFVHPGRIVDCPKKPPYRIMGLHIAASTKGQFKVDTNAQYPFGQGEPDF